MMSNALHGSTPAVRQELARLLLQRGANPTLEREVGEVLSGVQDRSRLARELARGLLAGAPVVTQRMRDKDPQKAALIEALLATKH